jgi:hypothetical protein
MSASRSACRRLQLRKAGCCPESVPCAQQTFVKRMVAAGSKCMTSAVLEEEADLEGSLSPLSPEPYTKPRPKSRMPTGSAILGTELRDHFTNTLHPALYAALSPRSDDNGTARCLVMP